MDSTVAGASGVSGWNPDAVARAFDNPDYTVKSYRIDPQTVRINSIADGVVSIAYGVHEDIEMADGKPVRLDAFDASVWKMTDNGWVCVLHTESLKGDPFGRDRMAGHSTS